MREFKYEEAPELFQVRSFFTEKEWKEICEALRHFDKDMGIDRDTIKSWISYHFSDKLSIQDRVTHLFDAIKKGTFINGYTELELESIVLTRIESAKNLTTEL